MDECLSPCFMSFFYKYLYFTRYGWKSHDHHKMYQKSGLQTNQILEMKRMNNCVLYLCAVFFKYSISDNCNLKKNKLGK